jgi:hypothetical protein
MGFQDGLYIHTGFFCILNLQIGHTMTKFSSFALYGPPKIAGFCLSGLFQKNVHVYLWYWGGPNGDRLERAAWIYYSRNISTVPACR